MFTSITYIRIQTILYINTVQDHYRNKKSIYFIKKNPAPTGAGNVTASTTLTPPRNKLINVPCEG